MKMLLLLALLLTLDACQHPSRFQAAQPALHLKRHQAPHDTTSYRGAPDTSERPTALSHSSSIERCWGPLLCRAAKELKPMLGIECGQLHLASDWLSLPKTWSI